MRAVSDGLGRVPVSCRSYPIVQRGRWCHTDIDEIYSRASLGEHVAASVALSATGGARSLEQVVPGWVQPVRFRR